MKTKTHTFSSRFPTNVNRLVSFHEDLSALRRLTPPPIFMQVHEDTRTSLRDGQIEFTLWFLLFPSRWRVQHEPGPNDDSFADRMLVGPMGYWRHEHIFEADGDGARLTDRLTIGHKPGLTGWITRIAFDGLALRFLFFYRHLITGFYVRKG
jgi:ligand-binding SRPBCC domain-containing protein